MFVFLFFIFVPYSWGRKMRADEYLLTAKNSICIHKSRYRWCIATVSNIIWIYSESLGLVTNKDQQTHYQAAKEIKLDTVLTFKGLLIYLFKEFCHEGNLSESGHACEVPPFCLSPLTLPAWGCALVPGHRTWMSSKGSKLEAFLDTI